MNANLNNLWDKARNIPLKIQVEDLLKKSSIDFVKVFDEARKLTIHEAAKKPPHYISRIWMADTMYGNAIGILYDNFPDLMKKDKEGRPYVSIAHNIRVYIKKLIDKKYVPNNIQTGHVNDLNSQTLFEDEFSISSVYAGFVLDNNDWNTEFKEYCISYLNEARAKEAAWLIDLRENEFRNSTPLITYVNPIAPSQAPLVRPKQDNEEDTREAV